MDITGVADWLTKAAGLIGCGLGIWNAVRAKRKETDARLEEENNLSMLAAIAEQQHNTNGLILRPEIGSGAWKRAEKLVEKGVLERGPGGRGYCLPGTFKR